WPAARLGVREQIGRDVRAERPEAGLRKERRVTTPAAGHVQDAGVNRQREQLADRRHLPAAGGLGKEGVVQAEEDVVEVGPPPLCVGGHSNDSCSMSSPSASSSSAPMRGDRRNDSLSMRRPFTLSTRRLPPRISTSSPTRGRRPSRPSTKPPTVV